jgi:hypothetical protein
MTVPFRRRTVAAAIILAAVAGCTGGKAKGGAFHPSGRAVTPSPSVVGEVAQFPFARDIQVLFEAPAPADTVRARVYADFRYLFAAYYYAGQTEGQDRRYEDRLLGTERSVFAGPLAKMVDDHKAPWGTVRFFDTQVTAVYNNTGAAVETCVDESRFGTKDAQSGKPDAGSTPSTKKAFFKIRAGMQRGGDGVWRLVSYETDKLPDPAAKGCQQ